MSQTVEFYILNSWCHSGPASIFLLTYDDKHLKYAFFVTCDSHEIMKVAVDSNWFKLFSTRSPLIFDVWQIRKII